MRSLKLLILFTFCFAVAGKLQAQFVQQMGYKDYSLPHVMNIGAGVLKATDSSAVLELGSDNSDKGLLLPRAHRSNIVHPKKGLAIYDLDWNKVAWFNGTNWDTSGSAAAGAANYNFDLPIQVAGNGHITLPGWHAPKWDSAFYRASFDTLTRYLRLTDISGASTYIYIPKGSSSGLDPRITDANISFWKTALSTNDTAAAFADFLRGKDTQNIKYRLDTMLNSVGKTSILDFSGGLIQNGTHVTALSDINYWNAGKLQGTPIASTLPTINQLIGFNGSQYAPVTPHLYSTINQITDTSFIISRPDGSQDTVAFSLPLPNTGVKLDTSSAYINNIVLQGSGILHTSPAVYNYSNHTATLTQTLATQSAYSLFGTGATSAKPTFLQGITDNYIASISASKITGVPSGGILYGRTDGTIGSSSQFTYDSATGRATVNGTFNTYNGYSVTNSGTGASSVADYIAINNTGMAGSFGVTGSNYATSSFANKAVVASNGGMALSVDNNLLTGGTDTLFFYVGGQNTVPFAMTPSGKFITPSGTVIGGSGSSGTYVTTTKYTSDSTVSRNLINSNTINKLDSTAIVGNNLNQYKQGSITKAIPIARYNFTSLADGQYLKYYASDSSFHNVAAPVTTQRFDSIQEIVSGVPTSGNIAKRSSDSSILIRVGANTWLPIRGGGSGSSGVVTTPQYYNLAWTAATAYVESPTGTFASSISLNYAVGSPFIPSGTDGYAQMDMTANAPSVEFGMDIDNTLEPWYTGSNYNVNANWKLWVGANSNGTFTLYDGQGALGSTASSNSSIGTWVAGDKVRLRRTASTGVITFEKSNDNWGTFTTIYTFTHVSTSGTVYIKSTIDNTTARLVNPKVYY